MLLRIWLLEPCGHGSLLFDDDEEEDGEECVRRDDELFGGRWGGKSIKHDAYAGLNPV